MDEQATKYAIANEFDPKPERYSTAFESTPETDDFILSVNSDPSSTWKANECLLTKSNPKYDKARCEE